MYIAMNRFKVKIGCEDDFISIWKNRQTYLDTVPGFISFDMLQGPSTETYTLFASHSSWVSKDAFTNWTESEQFRMAHSGAGSKSKDIYLGPPQFEGFTKVV